MKFVSPFILAHTDRHISVKPMNRTIMKINAFHIIAFHPSQGKQRSEAKDQLPDMI